MTSLPTTPTNPDHSIWFTMNLNPDSSNRIRPIVAKMLLLFNRGWRRKCCHGIRRWARCETWLRSWSTVTATTTPVKCERRSAGSITAGPRCCTGSSQCPSDQYCYSGRVEPSVGGVRVSVCLDNNLRRTWPLTYRYLPRRFVLTLSRTYS